MTTHRFARPVIRRCQVASRWRTVAGLLAGLLLIAACSPIADDINSQISESLAEPTVINNVGDSSLEGHTPQGFAGSGTGLFAGDNLNSNFPEGDGVQLFVAFPLPDDLAAPTTATLSSDHLMISGTPFEDLGSIRAAPVQFDVFSPEIFSTEALADPAVCIQDAESVASSDDESASDVASTGVRLTCDVTAAAVDAIEDGREHLQFRLRFDIPGDGDGAQDLALFFLTDSNTNEPGIFTLSLD